MKKITFLFIVLLSLVFNSVNGQTLFEWETATDNVDNITETIDGITVTFSAGALTGIFDNTSGYGGGTANAVWSADAVASATFTFSEAVDVNSIIAAEGNAATADYTFTPTGGTNTSVTVSLSSGTLPAPVDLNWTGVTSFTVTTSAGAGSWFFFDDVVINDEITPPSPTFTVFEFETATDTGDTITETIDGITATFSAGALTGIFDNTSGFGGGTANAVWSADAVASATFTFSEAVDVNSIIAAEGNAATADYTFTPTGGTNTSVTVSLSSGTLSAPVDLNWTGVTSFTVTTSAGAGSWFFFDDVVINDEITPPSPTFTVFEFETATDTGDTITETIDGITATFSAGALTGIFDNTSGFGGGTANAVWSADAVASATFTFSEAVDVNSIIAAEGNAATADYTFTPTGGTNTSVTVSLSSGTLPAPVDLNWTGVTSFTVTTSAGAGSWFFFDDVVINDEITPPSPTFTVFEFETATDTGDTITETIDGITATFSAGALTGIFDNTSGYGGGTANAVWSADAVASATFTFSEAVDVNSIIAAEGNAATADYTFTPTGGTNTSVTVSLSSGTLPAPVDLNWTGVTSFTVTTSAGAGSWFFFDGVVINDEITPPSPTFTVFEFETATDTGDTITETIDGITATFSAGALTGIFDNTSGFGGGTANAVWSADAVASATFTFSEAVDVNSIIAAEGNAATADYTFTPTGGTNTSVTVSLSSGTLPAPVDLNWTGVTSFTVTTSAGAGSWFFFDDLSLLSSGTLSTDDYVIQKARVYPNPVDNILYIKNITGLKSIKVLNDIGQQVLESTESSIDVSRLFQGMYLLQIDTNLGVETKRIIKR